MLREYTQNAKRMRFGAHKSRKITQSAILTSREGLSELLQKNAKSVAETKPCRYNDMIQRDSITGNPVSENDERKD